MTQDVDTSRDRPANEIEITPEMIEAGARVLMRAVFFDLSPGIAEELAEDVLRSGLAAR